MATKILIVEDEAIVAMSLADTLKRMGYTTSGPAATGKHALQCAERDNPDLVLMDIRIQGDMDGIETAAELNKRHRLPILYLTAYTDDSTLTRAQVTEPYGYLVKPFEERELRSAIEIALYRHKSEMKLRKVEHWLAATLRSAGDAVVSVDRDLRVNFINPMAEVLTGWNQAEALGRHIEEVLPITDPRGRTSVPAKLALAEGIVVTLEAGHTALSREGKVYPIDDSAAPIRDSDGEIIGVVVIFRSAQERVQLENRILSVQRLESLGRLAAGVAHDYNNLLTVIQGNLHSIRDGERIPESVEEALTAAERAGKLTRQLLTFGHERHGQLHPIDLREFLRESGQVLDSLLGENHSLSIETGDEDLKVPADVAMLEQVLTNLVVNARDALPDGGEVRVVLKSIKKEPPPGVEEQNQWAVMEVIDEGLGIEKEHLPKIFDPFFTTKPAGKGTGLGLATCHGVIRSHGGWLEVESQPGEGTTFRSFLPRICWDIAKPEKKPSSPPSKPGRILVVEDEELLARLITRILTGRGYQVLLAGNGKEAIALMKTEQVDLMLTDLSLPGGMTGRQLADYLREEHPSLRVAYMSGYSPDLDDANFVPELFLPKPFKPDELIELLHKTESYSG